MILQWSLENCSSFFLIKKNNTARKDKVQWEKRRVMKSARTTGTGTTEKSKRPEIWDQRSCNVRMIAATVPLSLNHSGHCALSFCEKPEVLWPEANLSGPPSLQSHSQMYRNIGAKICYWSEESYLSFIGHQQSYNIMEKEWIARVRTTSAIYVQYTIGAMNRSSSSPQVKLSLLHSISLNIGGPVLPLCSGILCY